MTINRLGLGENAGGAEEGKPPPLIVTLRQGAGGQSPRSAKSLNGPPLAAAKPIFCSISP
jgi:hypothetical protein